ITKSLFLLLLAAPLIRSAEISCVGTAGQCTSGFCFDRISDASNSVESACSKDGLCAVSGCEMTGGKFVCCCSENSCNGQPIAELKKRLEQWKRDKDDAAHPAHPKATRRALSEFGDDEEEETTPNPAAAPLDLKPPAPSTEIPLVRPTATAAAATAAPAAANTVPVVVPVATTTTSQAPATITTTPSPTQAPTQAPTTTPVAPTIAETTPAASVAAAAATTTEDVPETTETPSAPIVVPVVITEAATTTTTEAPTTTSSTTTTTTTTEAPTSTSTTTSTTTTTTTTTTTQAPTTPVSRTAAPTTTTTRAPETTTVLLLRAPEMPKIELDVPRPTEAEDEDVEPSGVFSSFPPLWVCAFVILLLALCFFAAIAACVKVRRNWKRSTERTSRAHVEQNRPLVQATSPQNNA
ncbi:hypothetical protein PENTCL1PPCAC_30446, partial [Pristionchus entomophagus]